MPKDAPQTPDMADRPLRLAFVAQLAIPEETDRRPFRRLSGGCDDAEAFRGVFETMDEASRFRLEAIHADRGEIPALDYDAVILGGSVASANDRLSWQWALGDWLLRWRTTGRPLLGICGGHQMMAQILGGTVSRRAQGPVSGTRRAVLTADGHGHWLFDGLGANPLFQFAHFDHVSTLPEGATALATGADTIAAADFGGGWVSVQFHPEVSCDRLATFWNHFTQDPARFEFLPGRERLIENFLRQVPERRERPA